MGLEDESAPLDNNILTHDMPLQLNFKLVMFQSSLKGSCTGQSIFMEHVHF